MIMTLKMATATLLLLATAIAGCTAGAAAPACTGERCNVGPNASQATPTCLSTAPAITEALGAESLCKCSSYGSLVRLVAGKSRHGLQDRSFIVLAIDRLAVALCADLILPPLASVLKGTRGGTTQEVRGEWADYFEWGVRPARGVTKGILKTSDDHLLIQHTDGKDGVAQLEDQYPRLAAPATAEELKKHIELAFKLWSAGIKLSIDIPIDLYFQTGDAPACDNGHENGIACGRACGVSGLSELLHSSGCSHLTRGATLDAEHVAEKITEGVSPHRFRVLHIRRGDTMKFGCDNSPPKVGGFVACKLEKETSSQAVKEKPELIIYFTDESDPTYHVQVVAELAQFAPHIIHGDKAARGVLSQNNITADEYAVYRVLFTHHFEGYWSFGGHGPNMKERCTGQTTCDAARRLAAPVLNNATGSV